MFNALKTASYFIFFTIMLSGAVFSQSVIDEVDESAGNLSPDAPSLATEKIERISQSKRIFIITNANASFDKGDFISMVLNNELVNRAIVAKLHDGRAGIKIVKIYSLKLWNTLRTGMDVQIIRGDDSYFMNLKKRKKKEKDEAGESLIQEEEDLFNEKTLLEDDLSLDDDKPNRIIKQDNIVSAYLGRIEGLDQDGNSARYNQINAAWAYQLEDNIFIEASYGQNVIKDYPTTGLDTKLTNLTVKGKYAIEAPFFSYLLPYVGFQVVNADSPGAGVQDSSNPVSETTLAEESARVEDLKKNTIVFGVTLLKRLVPGWFFRADLGSDIIGGGFALEF